MFRQYVSGLSSTDRPATGNPITIRRYNGRGSARLLQRDRSMKANPKPSHGGWARTLSGASRLVRLAAWLRSTNPMPAVSNRMPRSISAWQLSSLGRDLRLLVIWIVLLLLPAAKVVAQDNEMQGLRIRGEMHYKDLLDEDRNRRAQNSCAFELETKGRKWRLIIQFDSVNQRIAYGGDGLDLFWAFEDEAAVAERSIKAYSGNVFVGAYPVQSTTVFSALPWVAFCSGRYFETNSIDGISSVPAPWCAAWSDPVAYIYRVEYSSFSKSNLLPARLAFTPDRDRMDLLTAQDYKIGGIGPSSSQERDRLAIALESYFRRITTPEVVYTASDWKDYRGRVIPHTFQLAGFKFREENNGEFSRIASGVTFGNVSDVEEIPDFDYLPRLQGKLPAISVADYRFADSNVGLDFLSYSITNSSWLQRDDPLLAHIARDTLQHLSERKARQVTPSGIAFLAFAILAGLPAWLFVRFLKHRIKARNGTGR